MSLFGQNTTGQTGAGLFGSTTGQQQSGGNIFGTPGQPSLFGSSQQQPQQPASSLFGNTQGNSTSGTGLFGSSTTGNTNSGGLFGSGQQQQSTGPFGTATGQQPPAGGNMFGSTTQQQQQQQPSSGTSLFGQSQQQQPSSGTGLFGQTQQQQQPSGGLFGSTTTQQPSTSGTGLFGSSTTQQQPATGGLFGATTQQQQQPATGGSLFGSTTQQQQPSTTGGLFGSTTQQPATAGGTLFGSTTQQQQPSTGGGLFGSTTQQQQPSTGGSLFGASTTQQQQPATGMFGSTAQQQPATGGGPFGSSTTSGGGLFGSKPAGSLFGSITTTPAPAMTGAGLFGQAAQQQQQQPQQRPGLFGSTTAGTLFGGGSGLGTSALTTSALGRTASATAQQQFDAHLQSQRLLQKLVTIKEAWNPQSPQCRFQYNFYNLVDPNQIHLYGRPPNATDAIWDKAVRENPDPSCLVPVTALGFNDLRERVEAQTKQAEKHQTQLKDLKGRIDALNEQHTLSNVPRLHRASAQQTQIQQRLMRFIQHLHLLIPALRSSSIRPEEEQLRGRLEEIDEEIIRRSRLKAKLNELWALLGAINASREGAKNVNSNGEWAVVDEEGMAQIAQILAEQQTGLAHITQILRKMTSDFDIIMGRSRRSSSSSQNGDESMSVSTLNESERMWNPRSSTLSVSALTR
ncbi:hypothetical protein AX14_002114 [Amanita brunnescens Koide BX004]|nr:hypothetical protein AX14_002114 [Amanita brunnescens Koide BX004]